MCKGKYNEKTYIGIYIGDLPIQILTSYKESTGQLINSTMNNPAIFVPELKKIIYGCESWWKIIRSVDEFSKMMFAGASVEDTVNNIQAKADEVFGN